MRIAPALALPLLLFMPQIARSQSRDGDFRWERRLGSGQVVHARNINGDISVTPSSSGRVEIVGVRHGSGRSADRMEARGNDYQNRVRAGFLTESFGHLASRCQVIDATPTVEMVQAEVRQIVMAFLRERGTPIREG